MTRPLHQQVYAYGLGLPAWSCPRIIQYRKVCIDAWYRQCPTTGSVVIAAREIDRKRRDKAE